jgi:Holliday junction resolvase RusA-like endonuclease
MKRISFSVPGVPVPQGSKRAFVVGGRAVMAEANRETKPWRAAVAAAAAEAMPEGPAANPVDIELAFIFPRPKGHYGRRGLRPSAPVYKTTKPDIDKLTRAVLDAITGIVIRDDAQVVRLLTIKTFGDGAATGARVSVTFLQERGM